MPPLYNAYGARILRSKFYKDKPKTELPKLIWSKFDWSETCLLQQSSLAPKNYDQNLVILRSLLAISFEFSLQFDQHGIPSEIPSGGL